MTVDQVSSTGVGAAGELALGRHPLFFRVALASVLAASVLPALLGLASVDLGALVVAGTADPGAPISSNEGLAATALRGPVVHALLEWTAFFIAISVAGLSFVHYAIHRDVVTPILGTALLSAGLMDATHVLVSVGVIRTSVGPQFWCPLTWSVSRSLSAVTLLVGVGLALHSCRDRKSTAWSSGGPRVVAVAAGVCTLLAVAVVLGLAARPHLPQAMFAEGLLARPYDLVPLVLFLLPCLAACAALRARHRGIFTYALLLGVVPSIAGQFHMAFGSRALMDHDFMAAHALKVLSYSLPVMGLWVDYFTVHHGAVDARRDRLHAEWTLRGVQKSASVKLQASEARFQRMVERARDAVFVIDPDKDHIIDANPAACEMLGYSLSELREAGISAIHPGEMPRLMAFAESARCAGGAVSDQLSCTTKSGVRLPAEISAAFYVDVDGRTLMLAQVRDITARVENERRRVELERALHQAQKMDAIGRLAGGVAHDFNNLLTVINGYASLLAERLDDPSDRHSAEIISEAGQKGAALTRQLLVFSRKRLVETLVVDANGALEQLHEMFSRVLPANIKFDLRLTEGACRVRLGDGQLEQVVTNLLVNARDAMPDGGRLTLETAHETWVSTDEAGALAAGRYVVVSVQDTGDGISPAIRDQIFEPFFTTKEMGKGTGLGLSTVHAIIEQAGGTVAIDTAPGAGSRFSVWLPCAGAAPVVAALPAGLVEPPSGDGVTVLLAEDDAEVRQIVRATLEGNGYTVLAAEDGRAAVEMSNAHPGTIELLLTDIGMPRLDGPSLARQLRKARPEAAILFMSGYAEETSGTDHDLVSSERLLSKPFTPIALVMAVGEVLQEAQARRGREPGASATTAAGRGRGATP